MSRSVAGGHRICDGQDNRRRMHVAQGNKEALDLYAHLHYVVTQQTFLYQRPYVRMVKTLENWEQGNDGTESMERCSQ